MFWGLVSAASLPLGALAGLVTRPPRRVTSGLMAFGGGALLFALTIELFGHALHFSSDEHGVVTRPGIIVATMIAAVIGGLLFDGLNQLLNKRGGFLRKGALIKKHVAKEKWKHARKLLRSVSKVKLLSSLPAEEVIRIIPDVGLGAFSPGETIFSQGDIGDKLYFIVSGKVTIQRGGTGPEGDQEVAVLGAGDVFGEIALVSDQPRTATAVATTRVRVWEILKADFDCILRGSPGLQAAVQQVVRERLHELSERAAADHEAASWEEEALDSLERMALVPTAEDIREEVKEHHGEGAALAIWLGIALDGIPESLVIGMLLVSASARGASISLAFIAGVFLANLPEAMSSAVTMRQGGMRVARIFWMWTSLCIMTGIGAFIGASIFPPDPQGWMLYFIYAIEGLAGGAMLTMIAETMLPEAFEQGGGTVVGLSTLVGFLAALAVKLIQ
jgi:CRP-like cAMP-binding protein